MSRQDFLNLVMSQLYSHRPHPSTDAETQPVPTLELTNHSRLGFLEEGLKETGT